MGEGKWTNYGDVNFTEYGGIMVRPDPNTRNAYEYFMLSVAEDGDTSKKYAFHGTIYDLEDYKDAQILDFAVRESDGEYGNVMEFIEKAPERVVVELLNGYGHGPVEFSASNIYGTGEYSIYYNDFEVKSMDDLVKYINDIDIPAEFIPDHTFKVVSKYGEVGVEDSLDTFDWEKAKGFAHEKLMSGHVVTIRDTRDGSEAELDPGEYAEKFNGEFPIDPDRRLEVDYGEEDIEL